MQNILRSNAENNEVYSLFFDLIGHLHHKRDCGLIRYVMNENQEAPPCQANVDLMSMYLMKVETAFKL